MRPTQPHSPLVALVALASSLIALSALQSDAAPCLPLPAAPTGWWTAETDGNDATETHHATLNGTVTFTSGKVGQAFLFDGDDDQITIPHHDDLEPTVNGFTVEFWIKGDRTAQPQSLFLVADKSHGFADSTGWVMQGGAGNGQITFSLGRGNTFTGVTAGSNALDNEWNHVAGTWDGVGTARIYFDGVLRGSVGVNSYVGNTRPMNIGYSWGGGTPARFLRGAVDEMTVYPTALEPGQIQAIYDAGSAGKCHCVPTPTGAVSFWKGEDDANDSVGINHATLQNGATFADGKVGHAFSLDGSDDFVSVASPTGLPVGSAARTVNAGPKVRGRAAFT